jgi:hypothetical protein
MPAATENHVTLVLSADGVQAVWEAMRLLQADPSTDTDEGRLLRRIVGKGDIVPVQLYA